MAVSEISPRNGSEFLDAGRRGQAKTAPNQSLKLCLGEESSAYCSESVLTLPLQN